MLGIIIIIIILFFFYMLPLVQLQHALQLLHRQASAPPDNTQAFIS
jgi:hypothetical protein